MPNAAPAPRPAPAPARPEQRSRCARTLADCIALHPGPLARARLAHPLLASALL